MENRVVDEATNRLVLFHSLEEMFSPIFHTALHTTTSISTAAPTMDSKCGTKEHDGQDQKNEFNSPGDKSDWTQDQDLGSLSSLLALHSLTCASSARHACSSAPGRQGIFRRRRKCPRHRRRLTIYSSPKRCPPPVLVHNLPAT